MSERIALKCPSCSMILDISLPVSHGSVSTETYIGLKILQLAQGKLRKTKIVINTFPILRIEADVINGS